MKVTLKRLREIITEEVIKEELAPEIAAPAIAAMLQGTDSVDTSEIFGAVFDQMYGEGAIDDEAERMASAADTEPEEEDFPTEYQAGGAYGDRPKVGFELDENIEEIIKEELVIVLNEYVTKDRAAQAVLNHLNMEQQRALMQVMKLTGRTPDEIDALLKNPAELIAVLIDWKRADSVQIAESVRTNIETILQEYYIHKIENMQAKLLTESDRQLAAKDRYENPPETPPTVNPELVRLRQPRPPLQHFRTQTKNLVRDIALFSEKMAELISKGTNVRHAVNFMRDELGVDPIGALQSIYKALEKSYRNQTFHPSAAPEKDPETYYHEMPGEKPSAGIAGRTAQQDADERYEEWERFIAKDRKSLEDFAEKISTAVTKLRGAGAVARNLAGEPSRAYEE